MIFYYFKKVILIICHKNIDIIYFFPKVRGIICLFFFHFIQMSKFFSNLSSLPSFFSISPNYSFLGEDLVSNYLSMCRLVEMIQLEKFLNEKFWEIFREQNISIVKPFPVLAGGTIERS